MDDLILKRNENENIEDLILRYGTEIHFRISTLVCDALEANLSKIHICRIEPDELDLWCNKENYLQTLNHNLPFIEKMEEFELCSRMHKWISKLKKKNSKDDKS